MIVDAHSLPQNQVVETDICIVGSGTAGMTLAREFIGQKFRVCLLESGGLKPDQVTQALYRVVPTKQCGSIISISYIACLLAAHSEKSGVCKVKQGSILKPALLCRDYPLSG